MYAENAEDLQGDGAALNLENRFVASGNYIYSQYDADAGVVINSPGKANVFVQLEESTQEEGLDIVFGFANQITYTTDGHGTITGIEDESVYSHENPSGSKQEPNTGYNFTHWVADKDVTLTDGTTIEAGEPIDEEELTDVVIADDITFTAINEINTYTITYTSDEDGTIIKAGDPIKPSQIPLIVVDKDIKLTAINQAKEELVAPDTGHITKNGNNAEFTIISVSTVAALAGLLLISFLPKFFRKKIGFDK